MTEGALVISFNSETSPIFCCLQKQSRTNQRTVTVLYLWPSHSNEWKMNISSLSSQNRLNGDNTVPLGGCSGCRFVRRQPLTTSEVFLCHRVTDRLVSASAWEIFREGTSLSVSFPSHNPYHASILTASRSIENGDFAGEPSVFSLSREVRILTTQISPKKQTLGKTPSSSNHYMKRRVWRETPSGYCPVSP